MPQQQRVGWRSYISPLSSLLTSIYGVWNAETTTTTLATGAYGAWNGEGTVTTTQLTTNLLNVWNADGTNNVTVKNAWNANGDVIDAKGAANGSIAAPSGTSWVAGSMTYGSGKLGSGAFTFNGNNFISLPANTLAFTGDFSVSMWVYIPSAVSSSSYIALLSAFDNKDGYTSPKGWRIFWSNNQIQFRLGETYSTNPNSTAANMALKDQWVHITATRKSSSLTTIYINGVQAAQTNNSINPTYATNHLAYIGASFYAFSQPYYSDLAPNGVKIDAIQTWESVLDQTAITEVYNSGNGQQYPFTLSNALIPTFRDSFGSKHGATTITGNVAGPSITTGKISSAFSFDGINDYMTFPNDTLKLTGAFSINTWLKLNVTGITAGIISSSAAFSPQYGFRLYIGSDNKLVFSYFNSGVNYDVKSSVALTANIWYNISVVNTGSSYELYINGVLNCTNVTTSLTHTYRTITWGATGTDTVIFGNYGTSYGWYFNGLIDATNVWNKALTSGEVSALYNSGDGQQYPFSNVAVSGVPLDAVSTNHGTNVGGVTYTQGVVGTAFQFDGTSKSISLPNDSLNFTGDFSISLWINTSGGSSMLIGNTTVATQGQCGWYLMYSGSLDFYIYNDGSYYGFGTNTLTLNEWNHIVITSTSGANKIYRNGVLVTTNTSTVRPNYRTTVSPKIGRSSITDGFWYTGKMDAITTWTKVLTDDEIIQLYNMGGGIQYPFTTQTIKAPYAVYNGENLNDSVGTNNLTVGAGTVTYTTGKVGNAFTLAAGQLNFPTNSMRFSSSFSYGMWIKYTGSVPQYNQIFTATGNASKYGYYLYKYGTEFYLRFGDGTTVNNDSKVVLMAPNNITVNTWFHIVVVFNAGSNAQIYKDGQLIGSVNHTMASVLYDTTRPNPIIGNNPGGGTDGPMTGQVDGLTFWNSALTAPEVLTLFNDGTGMEYPYSSTLPAKLPSYGDVVGTNHGTSPATSTPTFTGGKVGKAYNFDGINDYVELPSNSLNSLTGNFSISMWVKWGRNNTSQILIANLNTNYGLGFFVEHAAGQLRFKGYKSAATNAFYAVKNSYTPTIGIWYHYTFTHKDQVNNIYENGVLIASDTTTTGHINHGVTNWPTIGANKYNSTSIQEPFQGVIDMVNIWSKELSADEVTSLYNSGNGKQYPNY